MVEGTQAQAAGRSIRELERRDDYLVVIQQVLAIQYRRRGHAALAGGAALSMRAAAHAPRGNGAGQTSALGSVWCAGMGTATATASDFRYGQFS
jgi:hypothetical protein